MSEVVQIGKVEPKGGFCETPTAADIFRLLEYCQAARELGLIAGAPGLGKTTALRHYAETRDQAYYVVLNPACSSMSSSLARIAEALGTFTVRRIAETHEIICNRLDRLGAGGALLLIDEAQHLNDQAVDQLRCIHDEMGVGMVFAGNHTLRSRFNNTRAAAFAQFTSRIGMRLMLDGPDAGDVLALCRQWDIGGAREVAFLERQATPDGGLRVVAKLAARARDLAPAGQRVQLNHLKAAAKIMGLWS